MRHTTTALALLLASLSQLFAANYTTKNSGDWNTPSNWVGNSVPVLPLGTNDKVTIATGDSIYCADEYEVVNKSSVIIQDGAILVLDNGVDAKNKLAIDVATTGSLIVNGGIKANNSATVEIYGSATITGTVTVNQGATISVLGEDAILTIDGDLVATGTGNSVVGDGTLVVTGTIDAAFSVDPSLTVLTSPLPVELVAFVANKKGDADYYFSWKTQSETDNEKFIIQFSDNGYDWDDLFELAGAGNSSSLKEYSCSVNQLFYGETVYFRLKQIDFSGGESVSEIISVDNTSMFDVAVETYPNPVVESVVVEVHEGTIEEMSVVDSKSRIVDLLKTPNSKKVTYTFQPEEHGVYYLNVKTEEGTYTQQVLVK